MEGLGRGFGFRVWGVLTTSSGSDVRGCSWARAEGDVEISDSTRSPTVLLNNPQPSHISSEKPQTPLSPKP